MMHIEASSTLRRFVPERVRHGTYMYLKHFLQTHFSLPADLTRICARVS